jgi:hypothetical protein
MPRSCATATVGNGMVGLPKQPNDDLTRGQMWLKSGSSSGRLVVVVVAFFLLAITLRSLGHLSWSMFWRATGNQPGTHGLGFFPFKTAGPLSHCLDEIYRFESTKIELRLSNKAIDI